jgi:hypothetical protein
LARGGVPAGETETTELERPKKKNGNGGAVQEKTTETQQR